MIEDQLKHFRSISFIIRAIYPLITSGISLVRIKSIRSPPSISYWDNSFRLPSSTPLWVITKLVSHLLSCFLRSNVHDCQAPCNMYPTPNVRSENISWLYEVLAENWIQLGLPTDTRDSILRGAFYTTVVRPGLRLISMNMNYCAQDNFWLYINATDPLDQLQWVSAFVSRALTWNSSGGSL